ncbi:MAG: nucleoside triphosphate pyrophosphatase [Pseudomonadota bacterium]
MTDIVLGSGSAIRARILTAAGVPFEQIKPDVDEDATKKSAAVAGMTPEQTAMRLAEEKALNVCASVSPERLVIGSDQILEFEGALFDKPTSMAAARARLLEMAGKTHRLINAVCVARDGAVLWRHIDCPALHMRAMTERDVDAYLDAAGDEILYSVGAYQVEALGARLFEKIDGDYFAVLGLSLYPLIGFLREEGALTF